MSALDCLAALPATVLSAFRLWSSSDSAWKAVEARDRIFSGSVSVPREFSAAETVMASLAKAPAAYTRVPKSQLFFIQEFFGRYRIPKGKCWGERGHHKSSFITY